MAKQLLFDDHARAKMLARRREAGRCRRGHDGPDRPQCDHRQVVRRPDRHQRRRHRQQGNRARRSASRTWAPSSCNEVAQKTSDLAGDGTTTATVLARAIFKEGLRNIVAGSNPMAVRRGIEKAVDAAVEQAATRWPSRSPARKKSPSVGAISANNDRVIGDLLADAMEKVGKDGVITVEEGKTTETTLELRRRHAVRQGLSSRPTSSTSPADDGVRARRRAAS